ncbi:DeoR/GlpR family DNA-binding transcription regulator [Eubacteriales bacterium OttesenSCG-928-A19]|nr:DeoR/GlpR family DNA-binding transcription regulator [Eubacteriales bacterium OttesenSCG-928-A19]
MQTRQEKILEQIVSEGSQTVQALSTSLGVSQVTIRKDLSLLAERGLIRREHGIAVLAAQDDLSGRLAYHHANKRRIASLAASSISDGETVMIESGSCCALLAQTLAQERQGVMIVTNSTFITEMVRPYPGIRVTLLGGEFQPGSQVLVGPLIQRCVETFHVDKLFIGMDGFESPGIFMGNDYLRAEAVRHMSMRAERVIILSESEKFLRQGTVSLMFVDRVAGLVTDDALDPEIETLLSGYQLEIRKAGEEEMNA